MSQTQSHKTRNNETHLFSIIGTTSRPDPRFPGLRQRQSLQVHWTSLNFNELNDSLGADDLKHGTSLAAGGRHYENLLVSVDVV